MVVVLHFFLQVRDYTFNVNSGVVESLELDSLGIPMIPSSLVGEVVTVLFKNDFY